MNTNILSRAWIFIQEARQELRRVNWPSREETIWLTIVVIILSITVAFSLGIFDLMFSDIFFGRVIFHSLDLFHAMGNDKTIRCDHRWQSNLFILGN